MRYDRDEFIAKAAEVHDGKYDYSKVIYVNRSTPVVIVCPEHGEFERKPSYHLRGGGCPVCAKAYSIECAKRSRPKRTLSDEARAHRRECLLLLQAEGKGPWAKKAREKAADTCVERFGAKTWVESDIGVETARRNCSDPVVRQQMSERAIYIWTYDDLRKRDIAEQNNLNYLVFWDNDLTDFKEWLNAYNLS